MLGYVWIVGLLVLWLGVFAAVELTFRALNPNHPLNQCRVRQAEAVQCLKRVHSRVLAPLPPHCANARRAQGTDPCLRMRYYNAPERVVPGHSDFQLVGRPYGWMAGDEWRMSRGGHIENTVDACARYDILDLRHW